MYPFFLFLFFSEAVYLMEDIKRRLNDTFITFWIIHFIARASYLIFEGSDVSTAPRFKYESRK